MSIQYAGLLIVAVAAFVAPVLAGLIPRRLIPPVVLEVLAGLAIGPQGLDLVHATGGVEVLYLLGFGFLLFLAGQEVQIERFRGPAFRLSGLSFLISLVLGVAAAFALRPIADGGDIRLLALAMTASSLGVIVPVLQDASAIKSDFGQLVVISGSVGEFGSLLLLTILFSAQPEPTVVQVLYVAALGVAAVAGAWLIRRFWQSPWMGRVLLGSDDSTSQLRTRGAFVILLVFSALAHQFGVDALLGAFIGGIVLNIADRDDRPNQQRFHGKLRAIGYGFLVPVFFVVTGVQFDIRSLLASTSSLVLLPALLGAILVVRAGPALLYRGRLGARAAAAAGLLQATTLTFPVVVAEVGRSLDLLSRSTAAALIGAALVSVLAFPALALMLRPWSRPGSPDGRLEPGQPREGGTMEQSASQPAGQHRTHWIGGKPWTGQAAQRGDIYNPATGLVSGTVDYAEAAEVDAAVAAAAGALPGWRETSLVRRAGVMFAFRELVRSRQDDLAALITAEHGKVASDAAGEVARGLEVVDFACGIPHLLKGSFSENVSSGVDAYSIRQPVGVVAGITPFNFPAMVPMWMFPIALACGNTFILKPSEKDPSTSLLLAELLAEAGLPDGAFNVVHGGKDAVDALLAHPDVRAVSFVGSTPIARYIYETGSAAGKRVQALGGAKNHMVVLPDADLDLAADAAVSAGFGSAGERCMAISVVVAVDPVGDELISKISERVAGLRVGPGDDAGSEMGPLVTRAHRDKVASYLDSGVAEGAVLAIDGRDHPITGGSPDGFWLGPSLLDQVKPSMSCYADEIFGPVLSVVRAGSYAEALAVINGSPYGNGTAIFTSDGGAARRFTHEVEVGMVGVNVPIPVPMAFYSFGGWKSSLFGDTHVHGTEGVHFYTRGKAVTSRWLDPSHGGVNLGFPVNQ